MNYGYFDGKNREYVITDPKTPAPWSNYLGSPEFGAIVTNNAGGYSFVKSGAAGRLLRYHFNQDDTPGRYIYLRDDKDGDFWSVSRRPAARHGDYECRHGLGYTVLSADYKGVHAEAAYFVPIGASRELWRVSVTNYSQTARALSAFGYAEFTTDGNYEQDQVNLQYTQFITRTYYEDGFIRQSINENCKAAVNGNAGASRVFALSGARVSSYCGDKAAFLGIDNGYEAPQAVVNGNCGGALNYGGNPCGALQTSFTLQPGETASFCFILAQAEAGEAERLITRYADGATAEAELAALKADWAGRLSALQVDTPSAPFNEMINTWHAYQCYITFIWSRAASLFYCGLRNGYGYRDTVQDIQGIIHLNPEAAGEKLAFMLSGQVSHGGALPLVRFAHAPGHEQTPEETGEQYRADDALWLFPTIRKYIAETGDEAFLDKVIPFADKGSATVYEHLRRAIGFSLEHTGIHGLPAGLHADWNDCLRLGAGGASVFVAFQLYWAFDIFAGFAGRRGDNAAVAQMKALSEKLAAVIEAECWDGDWFVRGISEGGEVVGSKGNKEAAFWLNPQIWAVISGYAGGERAERLLELTHEKLNTKYGAKLMAPPFKDHPFEGALALLFNPGMKENGGVFLQPQGWAILAEALTGNGDRAFEYYIESCPAAQNDIADTRMLEPYAYSQFTESDDSPNHGRSHVPWLTGTASTVMAGAVEGILGFRPDADGLAIRPAIPGGWAGFTARKRFRGKELDITVRRDGQPGLTLNGEALDNQYIPAHMLRESNEVILVLP